MKLKFPRAIKVSDAKVQTQTTAVFKGDFTKVMFILFHLETISTDALVAEITILTSNTFFFA